jgi:hypothetical protein
MRRALVILAMFGAAGCAAGLRDGFFAKDGVKYRVEAPADGWKKVDFQDNDLAWVREGKGEVIAVNATCADHKDPPLDVLTQHLLMGFDERVKASETRETIDGRDALRTHWQAALDGVPVELELVVMKKDGCVHDFSYVAPRGGGTGKPVFERLVQNFKAERTGS